MGTVTALCLITKSFPFHAAAYILHQSGAVKLIGASGMYYTFLRMLVIDETLSVPVLRVNVGFLPTLCMPMLAAILRLHLPCN